MRGHLCFERRREKPAVASTAPTCRENQRYYSNPSPLSACHQIICPAFSPPAGVLAAHAPLLPSRHPSPTSSGRAKTPPRIDPTSRIRACQWERHQLGFSTEAPRPDWLPVAKSRILIGRCPPLVASLVSRPNSKSPQTAPYQI